MIRFFRKGQARLPVRRLTPRKQRKQSKGCLRSPMENKKTAENPFWLVWQLRKSEFPKELFWSMLVLGEKAKKMSLAIWEFTLILWLLSSRKRRMSGMRGVSQPIEFAGSFQDQQRLR